MNDDRRPDHHGSDRHEYPAGSAGIVHNPGQMTADTHTGRPGVVDDDHPSIYDLIGQWCDRYQSLDAVKVAHRGLAEIVDDEWRTLVLPLFTAAVDNCRRVRVRQAEVQAFSGSKGTGKQVTVSGGGYEPNVAELRRLLNREFSLGGGVMVEWGAATEDEHLQRETNQAKLMAGIGADIARHRFSRKLIAAAGVTCLNDVPELKGEQS